MNILEDKLLSRIFYYQNYRIYISKNWPKKKKNNYKLEYDCYIRIIILQTRDYKHAIHGEKTNIHAS